MTSLLLTTRRSHPLGQGSSRIIRKGGRLGIRNTSQRLVIVAASGYHWHALVCSCCISSNFSTDRFVLCLLPNSLKA